MHVYEVRLRKDHRGVDLISDVLPFGRLWYDTPDNAVGYALHSSRSHDAVIRVYDDAGNVIETYEHNQSRSAWVFGQLVCNRHVSIGAEDFDCDRHRGVPTLD